MSGTQKLNNEPLIIEIGPVRVFGFDQPQFPVTLPALYTLFPVDSSIDIAMLFEPDKAMDFVLSCKADAFIVAVFPDTSKQIVRHARIERPISLRGKNVDKICTHNNEDIS